MFYKILQVSICESIFSTIEMSMDFVSQEHGVPRDGPKDLNAGG
jgi:hypothetical protein